MAWKKFTAESKDELRVGEMYLVQRRLPDDCPIITTMMWVDGWNCYYKADGTHVTEYEVKDIVAWMELPEFYEEEMGA